MRLPQEETISSCSSLVSLGDYQLFGNIPISRLQVSAFLLYIETEESDVLILHYIIFSFKTDLSFFFFPRGQILHPPQHDDRYDAHLCFVCKVKSYGINTYPP